MDFSYNPDQMMIAETVKRMFAANFPRDAIREFTRAPVIMPDWREALANSGMLGILTPAEADGLGLGLVDCLPIVIEAGSRLVPFPVAESIVAAAMLARTHPKLCLAIIAAEEIAAFAPTGGVTARPLADGWSVSGKFSPVFWAADAKWLIAEIDLPGLSARLVLLDLNADTVKRISRQSIDLTYPASDIELAGYTLRPADILDDAPARWTRMRVILAAAEIEGAARACLDMAVAYMKERKQFGQEIGRFQALKHIAATDALHVENMRLANEYAAWAHDANEPDAEIAASIAKQYASDGGRSVAQDSVQCHGGIGFTWEYGLHFYLRRILRLSAGLGTAAEHREALLTRLIAEQST